MVSLSHTTDKDSPTLSYRRYGMIVEEVNVSFSLY